MCAARFKYARSFAQTAQQVIKELKKTLVDTNQTFADFKTAHQDTLIDPTTGVARKKAGNQVGGCLRQRTVRSRVVC